MSRAERYIQEYFKRRTSTDVPSRLKSPRVFVAFVERQQQ